MRYDALAGAAFDHSTTAPDERPKYIPGSKDRKTGAETAAKTEKRASSVQVSRFLGHFKGTKAEPEAAF